MVVLARAVPDIFGDVLRSINHSAILAPPNARSRSTRSTCEVWNRKAEFLVFKCEIKYSYFYLYLVLVLCFLLSSAISELVIITWVGRYMADLCYLRLYCRWRSGVCGCDQLRSGVQPFSEPYSPLCLDIGSYDIVRASCSLYCTLSRRRGGVLRGIFVRTVDAAADCDVLQYAAGGWQSEKQSERPAKCLISAGRRRRGVCRIVPLCSDTVLQDSLDHGFFAVFHLCFDVWNRGVA